MSKIVVKRINAQDTLPLRQLILRQGRAIAECSFSLDNHVYAFHLAAFHGLKQVAILSVLPNSLARYDGKICFQIRGVAVVPLYRRIGVATSLLRFAEKIAREKYQAEFIWLNARIASAALYEKNGFMSVGEPFNIPSVGKHQQYIKKTGL